MNILRRTEYYLLTSKPFIGVSCLEQCSKLFGIRSSAIQLSVENPKSEILVHFCSGFRFVFVKEC
jgi:hypothetical protein